jgi:hypothetical protein
MFGKYIHPQLVDDLATGLCARFNIKSEPKDVVKFINSFGYDIEKPDDFISSGFPVGKIMSQDHYDSIQKEAKEKKQFFNIKTGRWMGDGNKTMVYIDCWCAIRNSPEHLAMLKIEKDDSSSEKEIEIDIQDDWLVVKNTNYIWSKDKEAIVGRLKHGKPVGLTHKTIKYIKKSGYDWERIDDDEIDKFKILK